VELDQLAVEIARARATKGILEPPSHRGPAFSIEDGYAVAHLLHERHLAEGARSVGLKLGFTNRAVWEAAGLTSPFWCPIYDDTVTNVPEVALESFVAPRIEPEVVLGFRYALDRGASIDEICAVIGWVAPGFEIVQCHYPEWIMSPADAIADAGLHGILVVGQKVPGPIGADSLAMTQVVLKRGDEVMARGSGTDALGGPIEAIAWLLRLPGVEGLPADSIVTTGTLTAACSIVAGETWEMECSGPLGRLEIRLT
jgi:2-oxo-3-hexenedioate decarboxylase